MIRLIKLALSIIALAVLCGTPMRLFAAANLVIRDFKSDIVLSTDDSLDITESIRVDFDSLENKHGIFRIIPMINGRMYDENRDAAISLVSITDESGTAYQYQSIPNASDKTLTWKIGSPNRTITGLHTYIIHYIVHNVVGKAHNKDAATNDELIWNLNGNFWELDADHYQATVHFPSSISRGTMDITLFSGEQGGSDNILNATSTWLNEQTLNVVLPNGFSAGEGVTLDATFPKGLINYSNVPISLGGSSEPISPFIPTPFFMWSTLLGLLVPVIVFYLCFRLWNRYGKDIRINKTIAPEFAPPYHLRPLQLGLVDTLGKLKNEFIAATIVDLGVRKVIKIEEVKKKYIFSKQDWKITVKSDAADHLLPYEQEIIAPFSGTSTLLSEGGQSLAAANVAITQSAVDSIVSTGYLDAIANKYSKYLGYWAIASMVVGFVGIVMFPFTLGLLIPGFLCSVIFWFFSRIMPKRTTSGIALKQQIEGFKLYMKTAETYRQQFFEKENMFETLLPYAIAFGLTKEWTKAVGKLDEHLATAYHPVWYVGSPGSSFNVDSFTSNLTSLSSSISTAMAPSSGSGGGFSGGGGGGGGGGGW